MKNDLLLQSLAGKNHTRPPVWLMRQAGRYQPEYRAIRKKHSFLEMVHTPEIAAEVTLIPIDLLDVDAAILFSDILTVAEALGVGLRFDEGVGPVVERPVRRRDEIPQSASDLNYVAKAIELLKPQLDVPLIGFAGGPFTVASYMVEGGSSRDLKKTKQWMLRDPEGFHLLLDRITEVTIDYLRMQAEAGADVLQLFDSWAMHLSYEHFCAFSLSYMERIAKALPQETPLILFCRGSSVFAPTIGKLGTAVGVDWNADLAQIRQQLPNTPLQGNLDPFILYAPKERIEQEVDHLLRKMEGDPAFIVNLGHGISPDMSVEAVQCLVNRVKESCYATA